MSLFINAISNNIAGMAIMALPSCEGDGNRVIIEGFLAEDPIINLKNNWDSAIPDISSINDFTQIAGKGASSWLATSKAAWKGTAPIKVTLNFFLITYLKAQIGGTSKKSYERPISEQAARLGQLLAVGAGSGSVFNFKGTDLSVSVHGGYKPAYFERNAEFLGLSKKEQDKGDVPEFYMNTAFSSTDDSSGTVQIAINGKNGQTTAVFTDMLLEDATFTPSTVRTGYWQGNQFITSAEPLYIKVSATFRLAHAATVADVARMFTGRSSL